MTEVTISDDGQPEAGLFVRLAREEKKIAEEEGREPEGWLWVEGMAEPRWIDFDALDEEDEPRD